MTHAAFQYAAFQNSAGLVSELDLPYSEGKGGAIIGECNLDGLEPAAHIAGWAQAVGVDCSASSDPNELLKLALQDQSLSVAVNSQGDFKNYKGGIYKCPNDGNFAEHSMIDHALVLVGYGTDPEEGDYWILKNSYGASWGEGGFMRLHADNKINCGVSIYPVKPEGASMGSSSVQVDTSGGGTGFMGLNNGFWLGLAAIVIVASLVLITIGAVHARRTHAAAQQQSPHLYALQSL